MEDLPPELKTPQGSESTSNDWEPALKRWSDQYLASGAENLLDTAMPAFERIVIKSALTYSGGRRQDAAKLLGWGRNTLTRKIKELGMETEV